MPVAWIGCKGQVLTVIHQKVDKADEEMQQSKIQQYCEAVIEAGWLAALIVAPLFFNTYSSRVFEPDKISLVRSISLVMLLAYLVKIIDGGRLWLSGGGGTSVVSGRRQEVGDGPVATEHWSLAKLLRLPFLLPVALLVAAYALSTIFSISPYVSWWGSYHRLQGTFTFISYLIIAVLTAAHLRQPDQLRRLQHTVILTSLPIAIYGVIQHYVRDPLPWGEDVTTRIAANAGNAIFLAAYLIMAFFLTLERVFSSFAFLLTSGPQPIEAAALDENKQDPSFGHILAGTLAGSSYLFVLVVQLFAIFWAQSRGPWLGLATGIYICVLLLLTGIRPRNYRAWRAVWVGLGVAGAVFLVLLNTTALGASFSRVPIWGRLTTMLDSSSGTGRVRVLIWEGTAKMISPHPPLAFPDGKRDAVNPLRPLIGYGPETTWMAFNRFYPPELAQWEARNRAPDRSHNETWDSLAITGIFGFLASSLLFLSIFYWALRWLGLIRSRRDAGMFLVLLVGGGVLLSALFLLRGVSVGFLGVNWPTGMILGLIVYVTLAVFLQPESTISAAERPRQLLLAAALSAIIAHYVEIQLGIAIAATRVYFWTIGALLLVLGMRWLLPEPIALEEVNDGTKTSRDERRGRERQRRSTTRSTPSRRRRAALERSGGGFYIPATVMPDLLVTMTLAYLFTTNFLGLSNPFAILFGSPGSSTQEEAANNGSVIMWLLVFTWIIAAALSASTAILCRPVSGTAQRTGRATPRAQRRDGAPKQGERLRVALVWAGIAALYGLILFIGWFQYGLIQAGRLLPRQMTGEIASHLDHFAGHFSLYTWIVVFWCLIAGLVLAWRSFAEARRVWMNRTLATMSGAALLSVIAFFVVGNINIAQVRADIFYKQGQTFDMAGKWVPSADMYRRALTVRPTEDYYMLFWGRSLLQGATVAPQEGSRSLPAELSLQDALDLTATEVEQLGQEDLLRVVEIILQRAQELNPLNIDHTANLARLHNNWAKVTDDPQLRMQAWEKSARYYEAALALSPYAAHLWNEKGTVLASMGQHEEAEAAFRHSLFLDDRYDNTYILLAELYQKMGEMEKGAEILQRGLEIRPGNLLLLSHLGVALVHADDLEGALKTNLQLIELDRNNLGTLSNLLVLYRDLNRSSEAMPWADQAAALLESGHSGTSADIHLYSLLVELYHESGRLLEAVDLLHDLIDFRPDDYRYPLRLAYVYYELSDIEQARQFGENALTIAPNAERPEIQAFIDSLE